MSNGERYTRCKACGVAMPNGSPSGAYCTRSCRILGESYNEACDRLERDNSHLRKVVAALSEILWRRP